jgi:hypothetical protein
LLGSAVTETYQGKEHRRGYFESRIRGDALCEILRQFHVLTENPGDSFAAEIPQYEPQLE